MPILRGARSGTLIKAAATFELEKKWIASKVQEKLNKFSTRRSLTDFERFQVMLRRKQRSYALGPVTAKLMPGYKAKGKSAAPAKEAPRKSVKKEKKK